MFRIMIVDDEVISQESIKHFIKMRLPEYQIQHVCSNGQQALKLFEQDPSDIILTDIRMPVMNGIALIEALSARTDDFVPIIISGYAEFEYAKSAMRLGVSHYLLKPLDFKELERSILAATHTLTAKRKQKTSLDWAEENQEIFFSQLISGQYQSSEEALTQFDALHLPFAYHSTSGVLVTVRIAHAEKSLYESDYLLSEVMQILQEHHTAPYAWMLDNHDGCIRYLLVGSQLRTANSIDITHAIAQDLDIDCSLVSTTRFSSFEELRTAQLLPVLPSAEVEDIRSKGYRQSIEPSIAKAVAYMNEHYAEDLPREMVAEKVFMSGAHFSRCFKLIMNKSYKDYLTEIRMRNAIELLNTDARIQDIARQVGYPNANRFNINFKSYTSYTPSEYRRDVLKKYVD